MNIYINKSGKEGKHIGKRSAAGIFCYDCKQSLWDESRERNLEACPKCGNLFKKESYNPAMKELGFDSEHHKPTGIDGTSAFCWQIGSTGVARSSNAVRKFLQKHEKEMTLRTEYGDIITVKEFFEMFDYIGIERFLDSEFS